MILKKNQQPTAWRQNKEDKTGLKWETLQEWRDNSIIQATRKTNDSKEKMNEWMNFISHNLDRINHRKYHIHSEFHYPSPFLWLILFPKHLRCLIIRRTFSWTLTTVEKLIESLKTFFTFHLLGQLGQLILLMYHGLTDSLQHRTDTLPFGHIEVIPSNRGKTRYIERGWDTRWQKFCGGRVAGIC